MKIFFHGWCYKKFHRFMLIHDKDIYFSVDKRDQTFSVNENISKYQHNIVSFDSYIEQCQDIHCRLRSLPNNNVEIYTQHDLLNVSWLVTTKLNCTIINPHLVDCSTIAEEYFTFYEFDENAEL